MIRPEGKPFYQYISFASRSLFFHLFFFFLDYVRIDKNQPTHFRWFADKIISLFTENIQYALHSRHVQADSF